MLDRENLIRFGFLIAVFATLGSLYFSDVLGYPPCVLCWYQRIAMYPLVIVFGVSLWRGDKSGFHYAAPLVLIGLSIAIYHNLLYYHVIPDSITPCTKGVSCTSRQVELLGFLTIPLMSLMSFTAIALATVFALVRRRE